MRIFVLEDSQDRIVRFRRETIGHVVDYASQVSEAVVALGRCKYDLVFLDHDLGGQEMLPSGEETGYAVAQYLAKCDPECQVVVHSCNPSGAQAMASLLVNAQVIPFIRLDISNVVAGVEMRIQTGKRFQEIAAELRGLSLPPTKLSRLPAYMEAMELGEIVVPLMIRDMIVCSSPIWCAALRKLVGYDVVPRECRGDAARMVACWAEWAKNRKLIGG